MSYFYNQWCKKNNTNMILSSLVENNLKPAAIITKKKSEINFGKKLQYYTLNKNLILITTETFIPLRSREDLNKLLGHKYPISQRIATYKNIPIQKISFKYQSNLLWEEYALIDDNMEIFNIYLKELQNKFPDISMIINTI